MSFPGVPGDNRLCNATRLRSFFFSSCASLLLQGACHLLQVQAELTSCVRVLRKQASMDFVLHAHLLWQTCCCAYA